MAKKYRNLIERIIAPDNMRHAYYLTAKGRRFSSGALHFKEFAEANLGQLALDMHSGQYAQGVPHEFMVFEPKPRLITAIPFRDRVAQHAMCNIIGPIFDKTLLPRTFACRTGMGSHAGVVALQAELRRSPDQPYFLKTDYSKFFSSIDRAIVHRLIRKKISCNATLAILDAMIKPEGIGLPIGSLTSQIFANVYGGMLDRHLQQTLGESQWYRYMDDVVVLGDNPHHLRALRDEIERFSAEHMGLRFSKWFVAPVSRGINFLGYRIWPTHKLLRRQSVTRAKRKILRYRAAGDDERLQKFLAAWLGHARWADVHHLLRTLELEKAR